MTIHVPALHLRRKELEDRIAELIDLLDLVDGDCDFEEPGDAEPILGWPENGPSSLSMYVHDDREVEDENDEDGADSEDGGDTEPNGDEGDYNGSVEDFFSPHSVACPLAPMMAKQALKRARKMQALRGRL